MVLIFPHFRKWRGNKVSAILPFFSLVILLLISTLSTGFAADAGAGEKLFKSNCVSCHYTPDKDQTLVGPSLKNVFKVETDSWLMQWIKNNGALRKSGDKDALAIYDKFNHTEMTTFLSFSDDDLKNIIEYIKVQSVKVPTTAAVVAGKPNTGDNNEGSGSDGILWAVVVILVVLVVLVTRINRNLNRLVLEKAGEKVPEPRPLLTVLTDKRNIAAVALLLIIISGYEVVDYTQTLGRSKGYSPEQPIHFSHLIHAGQNQINCLYCHAGAEKSKTASIPTVNICMNCHKAIKEGPRTGTHEIDKIYAAYDNNQPIKWIKIHNLPDYVYFNHSQHVAIGKIACQKCHGPIETMDQVYQFSSLSMGWCINCHRETGVQFTANKYYDAVYANLHKDLKDGKISKVTEEMMGGTECQKCHY